MGAVIKPEELYEKLADRIQADDGPGTKRVFRQLLEAGRPRPEIISRISRLIEQQSPEKTLVNRSQEIREPEPQSLESSQVEEQKKPSSGPNTPVSNAADQRLDGSAARTSLNLEILGTQADPVQGAGRSDEVGPEPQITAVAEQPEKSIANQEAAGDPENAIMDFEVRPVALPFEHIMPGEVGASSGYADLSVLERLASNGQFPSDLTALESRETEPAEAVPLIDGPRAAHRSSRAWSPAQGKILIGTSITVAAAALFVVWGFYGSELEELSLVNVHHALTWFKDGRGTKLSSIANPEKPTEITGAHQAAAVRQSEITMPSTTALANPSGFAGRADIPTVPNTDARSAVATAKLPENPPSRMEAPPSQADERALSPSSTPVSSEQNETDASQHRQTAGPQLPPIDTGTLLTLGDQFLSQSDVASARLLYQRAAEAGDGRGALRMGMTFDRADRRYPRVDDRLAADADEHLLVSRPDANRDEGCPKRELDGTPPLNGVGANQCADCYSPALSCDAIGGLAVELNGHLTGSSANH